MSSVRSYQDSSIRRRAASMKHSKTQRQQDTSQLKKAFTLNKRSSHILEGSSTSQTFFSVFADKKKSKIPEDPEVAMDLLDQQIARIRGELSAMKVEGKCMVERVAKVTAAVDAAVTDSRCNSTSSSLESVEGRIECTKSLGGSTSSLPASCGSKLRDSGFVYDPNFEMCDPQKYGSGLPNNFAQFNLPKKTRSATAIDFIKNDLREESCQRLKATSIDRLSCYSDSVLLSIPGLRYH